ncbi:hypothetical protein AURDEDRAFT_112183 [Auricularia subglabra TFB-10046 SS5]|nr:hypothetical protein AURDEDRAFT_112183 [Auricularia subglabra TFB-10046 SS5]
MAADFALVDPAGWELDLHSVYSAYMGHFQLHGVPWYERSWASLFTSFDAFLSFGWPVVVVTDSRTGRPHIATRLTSVGAFVKMVKTRFGEVLPPLNNIMMVQPFETSQRHLRTISDLNAYKKLATTLPAAALSARRARVRAGDVSAIRKLWEARESVWLAVSCDVSERSGNINAWGYAVLRAAHLEGSGIWPPNPGDNYRKGHYVVAEALERKTLHSSPRDYVWADHNIVPRAKLADIVGAVLSSLAGPEIESQPNSLVLVAHGDLPGFAELKVKIPSNAFVVDTSALERQMYTHGMRGQMLDPAAPPPGRPRASSSKLSLEALLRSLDADLPGRGAPAHVAGNDAFATLLALQLLMGDRPQGGIPAPHRPRFPHNPHSLPLQHMTRPALDGGSSRHSSYSPMPASTSAPAMMAGVPMGMGMGMNMMAMPAMSMSMPMMPTGGPFRGAALLQMPGPPSPRRAHAQPAPSSPSPKSATLNGRRNGSGGGSSDRDSSRRRVSAGGIDDITHGMSHLKTSSTPAQE